MRISVAITIIILFAFAVVADGVQGQGRGGGKGKGPRAGKNAADAGVQNRRIGQQGGGQMPGGRGGMQNAPTAAQMAQMMVANFDQNADGALDQAELERAMTALMQRMQQMQQMQANQRLAGRRSGGGGMMNGMGPGQMRAGGGGDGQIAGRRGGGGRGAPAGRGGGKRGR